MKNLFLIGGIVSIVACIASLLFSLFNRFGYYNAQDGSSELYRRLRRRMNASLITGAVFGVVGAVCMLLRFAK